MFHLDIGGVSMSKAKITNEYLHRLIEDLVTIEGLTTKKQVEDHINKHYTSYDEKELKRLLEEYL